MGKNYERIKAIRQIDILDYQKKGRTEFFDMYSISNRKGEVYSDDLQIYTLNLRNLDNATEPDRERGLVDWGKLFAAQTWEDVKMLAKRNSIFREAGEIMGHAMTQEEDMLRRRQIAILDIETGMHEARSEGRTEGKAEAVKALMTNLGFSFEKAVAALNIAEADAAEIRKTIG